jgi:predicted alpha/beta hydrolase family esterase
MPFPSIVVASTDDPYVSAERASAFARAWGSRLVTLQGAGHINTDSGYGEWREGRRLLDELRAG